ncbi:MAG: hypothetical protein KDA24_04655 [Deltaproteobacteria bacterium]|nr:hypothetical protein [Deltaproteobacteria bacterium]
MNSSRTNGALIRAFGLAAALSSLALPVGCGGGAEGEAVTPAPATGADVRAQRAAERQERHDRLMASGRERGASKADPDAQAAPLAFDTIGLTPEAPKANTKQFRAATTLLPGATPYTEVEYQWFVGGKEIVGYKLATLRSSEGKWKTGDVVEVIAHASDEKGRQASSKPARVTIDNTPPVITTDLRKIKYLSGTRLEAHDVDGDEVTWSVDGDPPGVTVSEAGVVNVRNVQVTEDWSGEAVFVATDPYGARSEIHIPLSVNAKKDAFTEDAGTKEDKTTSRTMTDEELQKAADADAERFEGMSEEEINAELDRRDGLNK